MHARERVRARGRMRRAKLRRVRRARDGTARRLRKRCDVGRRHGDACKRERGRVSWLRRRSRPSRRARPPRRRVPARFRRRRRVEWPVVSSIRRRRASNLTPSTDEGGRTQNRGSARSFFCAGARHGAAGRGAGGREESDVSTRASPCVDLPRIPSSHLRNFIGEPRSASRDSTMHRGWIATACGRQVANSHSGTAHAIAGDRKAASHGGFGRDER